jgi:hypothetical protein
VKDKKEKGTRMDGMVRAGAGALALALLAACDPGAPGTVASDPMAAANDTVAAETEAGDPMEPGAMEDSLGTQIPGD